MHWSRVNHALNTWLIIDWSHEATCTDHVADHTVITWPIMHWSQSWSFTDYVTVHALITWIHFRSPWSFEIWLRNIRQWLLTFARRWALGWRSFWISVWRLNGSGTRLVSLWSIVGVGGTDELAAPTVMFRMKKKWCFYNPVVMSPHKHLTVLCYHWVVSEDLIHRA